MEPTISTPRLSWRERLDPLTLAAAAGVAALIAGEIVLLAWVVSEPRSRQMRKEIHTEVGARSPSVLATPPSLLPAAPAASTLPVAATADAAAPAVLNRMVKIQQVERVDGTDGVTLRIQLRSQVGERTLEPAAVGVSVQWDAPSAPGTPTIWLQIPAAWDNFSAKTLTARWDGPAAQLRGYSVRTYYRGKLQDVWTRPSAAP